jgi:hypothetical protein
MRILPHYPPARTVQSRVAVQLPARSRRAATGAFPAALLLLGLLLPLLPRVAAAQQQPAATPLARINGYVLDQATRRPLPSASIDLPELGLQVVTNAEGRFFLGSVPWGTHTARVRLIGYADFQAEWEVREQQVTMTVVMGARPVALEGVTAMGYRFGWELERRRRSLGISSRVIDRRQLAISTAWDARQLLGQVAGLSSVPCNDAFGLRECVWSRGQAVRPRVVIDERPAFGIDELEFYRPHELYAIEVYSGGAHIRAYTTWWVEAEGQRGRRSLSALW